MIHFQLTQLVISFLFFGLVPASNVLAQQPDEREFVGELIVALDETTTRIEREVILKQLRKLGTGTLLAIENPPDGISRQTELLLSQLKNQIEKLAIQAEIKPARFTLSGTHTVDSALKIISSQTGIQFHLQNAPDTKNDFDLPSVKFWKGFDQVLDSFQLDLSALPKTNGLSLVKSGRTRSRLESAFYAGKVRVEAIKFDPVGKTQNTNAISDKLTVRFRWEPSLTPYRGFFDFSSILVLAKNDAKLPTLKANRIKFNIQPNQAFVDLVIPFKPFPRNIKSIASLAGKFGLAAPVGRELFEFSKMDFVRSKSIRKADVVVTLDSSSLKESEFRVNMHFSLDGAGSALETHHGWMFQNQAYLLDLDSQRISPKKMLTTMQKKDRMGFSFFFQLPKGHKGHKFVYEMPTSIQEIPIEFRLKTIPLQ